MFNLIWLFDLIGLFDEDELYAHKMFNFLTMAPKRRKIIDFTVYKKKIKKGLFMGFCRVLFVFMVIFMS
jgi:hypothetical protein